MIITNTSYNLAGVSILLQAISPEPRLEILLAIGEGEACVCHLESVLGYRQAYISQQLMALREAGLLETRRDGKYIFYRLVNSSLLEFLYMAGTLAGVDAPGLEVRKNTEKSACDCPSCERAAVALELTQ